MLNHSLNDGFSSHVYTFVQPIHLAQGESDFSYKNSFDDDSAQIEALYPCYN